MQTSSTNRIAKWDNVKWIMILLVVIGHTIDHFRGSSHLAKSLYLFIYTFHMPVFVFVSGLFAKKTIRRKNYPAIYSYAVIYVIMKFTIAVAEYLPKGGDSISLNFFYDKTPAWYALAMLVFFLVTIRLRYVHPAYLIPASIILSCIAGYSKLMGDHYVSMRIVSFYPFFLAGYFLEAEQILFWMNKVWMKILSLCILLSTAILCWFWTDTFYPLYRFFKGAYPYAEMQNDFGFGLHCFFMRFAWYGFAALMSFCIMSLIPKGKTPLTALGAGTISVFMWHSIFDRVFFRWLKGASLLKAAFPTYYTLTAILIAVIVTVVLSQPLFARFSRLLITLPIRREKREGRERRRRQMERPSPWRPPDQVGPRDRHPMG